MILIVNIFLPLNLLLLTDQIYNLPLHRNVHPFRTKQTKTATSAKILIELFIFNTLFHKINLPAKHFHSDKVINLFCQAKIKVLQFIKSK